MRLKSYFAGSVEAAISLAARELGDEAMLVYSREAAPEARYLGRYEVVFALPEPAGETLNSAAHTSPANGGQRPAAVATSAAAAPPVRDAAFDQVRNEMQALRAQMDSLAARVSPAPGRNWPEVPAAMAGSAATGSLESALAAAEMPAWLSRRILDEYNGQERPEAGGSPVARLGRVMEGLIAADASLEEPAGGCRVVAVVGPPGVGKTTALVKIAARFGLAARRPVQIINFDNLRIAGAEQLRTYAAILGVGFQALETAGALAQALEEHRYKQLVLIDTAGISGADTEEGGELARLFAAHPEIDVHLALSAAMKPADLTRVADRFARLRPNKLLFTRLDETSTFGPLWAEAVARALPISFLSEGQQIPEDLREATREYLCELVLGASSESLDEETFTLPQGGGGAKSDAWSGWTKAKIGAGDSAAVAA